MVLKSQARVGHKQNDVMDFSSAKVVEADGPLVLLFLVKFVTGSGGHTNYLKVGVASVPFHVPTNPASDEDRLSQR